MSMRRSKAEVYNELQRFEGAMDQRMRVMEDKIQQLLGRLEQLARMLLNDQRGWMPQLQRDIRELPNILQRGG